MTNRREDLLEQAAWWLAEANRCTAVGALGLAAFCQRESLVLRDRAVAL